MGLFNRFRPNARSLDDSTAHSTDPDTPVAMGAVTHETKGVESGLSKNGLQASVADPEEALPAEDAQRGIQAVEATTLVWSKKSLIAVFICMWLVYLLNAFQSSTIGNFAPYVTSAWESHSLLTVISVIASSMTAAVFIPLAKALDVWGRAEGYLTMVAFAELGLILMAVSKNLATYCAANVFYSVGFTGLIYSIDVVTADATNLKNRALAYAFTSSPYMISAFAGSYASDQMLYNIGWGWGYATYAFIMPVVCAPLYILLKLNLRKAKKQGLLMRTPSGRKLKQSIWHYIIEFDVLGIFLFAAGLIIFLLPFNIASIAPNGWATGYIIAMIIVGFILLVAFALNELYLAPVPFLAFSSLTDRTLVGACLLDFTYQISYYCWNSYFTSFLQVVNYLTVAEAGYVNNTFSVVSGFLLFLVGYGIRRTGYFKWLLWIAVPLYIFAQGLMIYFRTPTGYVGYIVMTQIFISIGGSVFIICCQVAVLAAVDHQFVAAALAMLNVTGTVGDSIGYTISGVIWTNVFEKALIKYLPESAQSSVEDIYNDIDVQLSYAKGTPERIAIQKAYGYAQTRMLAAGTAIMTLAFIWVFMMRNLNVAKLKQTKGNVF
ncbi:hypothetical protein LTR10_016112 [Elasticomyces elasticus]|uniref:Major facilitator superfamily (MFS) profile domain-containing protein n=1 Tax=Exophiala sideris TaxID=1016849 RepID=A0ABR0IVM1_9EURO|nr:hypothetical protein LTR10_016112 [Elasticomyces elasticus]KAK5021519.1 hypothetical protein LTS07_010926 [Exophiala sideris]KAK5024561.1 hypothetical protein LTR13_010817 [Exophiala sideris]KAK5049654.1 hypothetical protein LTR69_010950 [Exophiala sideris]KAK5176635.1 hypothetical protein LTR44_010817 [Eurotiomycetes sp. CCFEE 6388]